jgi:hypothetical protein
MDGAILPDKALLSFGMRDRSSTRDSAWVDRRECFDEQVKVREMKRRVNFKVQAVTWCWKRRFTRHSTWTAPLYGEDDVDVNYDSNDC